MVVGTKRCHVCDELVEDCCGSACRGEELRVETGEDDGYGDWLYEQVKDRRMMEKERKHE